MARRTLTPPFYPGTGSEASSRPPGRARPGRPAQLPRRLAHPDHPRRDAGDDRVGGDVPGDHRVGADDRVVADPDAAQDAGAVADPDVGADLDVAHVDPLLADRALDLDDAVVEVDEHRPVGDHALLADPHPLVGGDRALLAHHRLRRRSRPPPRGSGSWCRRRSRRSGRTRPGPCGRSAVRGRCRRRPGRRCASASRPGSGAAATGSARAAARIAGSASRCGPEADRADHGGGNSRLAHP